MNRESYLKKFHELKLENIKNGLGSITNLDWLDLDSEYSKGGNTVYESRIALFDESYAINETAILESINNPALENKLDYLHNSLRMIKILNIERDGEYVITRKIVGNQFNHLFINVKAGVNASLFVNTQSINNLSIATDFFDVYLQENSHLKMVDLRNFGNKYFVYSRKNVHVSSNANIECTSIEGPSKLNITKMNSILEKNNSGSLMNVLILSSDSEYNLFMKTTHEAPRTKSLMQCRSILNNSKAVVRGLISIGNSASSSNGYQKNDSLLLDKNSRMVSIPDLEIHNDDVKCSHGSSITRPDIDKIFYLQSRGLSSKDARKLFVRGFCDSILSNIPESFNELVQNNIDLIFEDKSDY